MKVPYLRCGGSIRDQINRINFSNSMNSKALHMVTFGLLVIGGLNWGLTGIGMWLSMNLNIVNLILGSIPWLEALIYVLVGLSTIWVLVKHRTECKTCMGMSMASEGKPAMPAM